MAVTRTVVSPGVWAENATTTIPSNPTTGVPYRDSSAGADNVGDGWAFRTQVASDEFNEILYRYSSVLSAIDVQGILGWTNLVDYVAGQSIVRGSDNISYVCIVNNGPSSTVVDPVSDTSNAHWHPVAALSLIGDDSDSHILNRGQSDTRYVNESQIGVGSDASIPNRGQADARYLLESNNLADLVSSAAARLNLGLGTSATADTGTADDNVPTISDADARYIRGTLGQLDGNVPHIGDPSVSGRSAVVVNAGSNANGYYRVWSDGVKEMYGVKQISPSAPTEAVTLPISFSSIIRYISGAPYAAVPLGNDSASNSAGPNGQSLNSILVTTDAGFETSWYALGV